MQKLNKEVLQIFAVGAEFFVWMKILGENKFSVSLKKLPKAFIITFIIVLFSPFAIFEKILSWKKLRNVKLKYQPIFIVGHWRQGTTFLHELFNCDPNFEVMTLYESVFPNHFLYFESLMKRIFGWFLPETRPQDDVKIGVDAPHEHDFAIANLSSMSPYVGVYFPDNQDLYNKYATLEGMTDKQIRRIKTSFDRVIKKLTLLKKYKRLVLKSPVDTARVKFLLELYPEAKFVHIIRNPYEVFYSTRRMHEKLVPVFQLQEGYPDLDEFIFHIFEGMYNKFYEDIEEIPDGNFIEIRYENFVTDPKGTMAEIYKKLSLPDFEKAEPFMDDYLDITKDFTPTCYNIPEKEINVIDSRWHKIIEKMNYKKPI